MIVEGDRAGRTCGRRWSAGRPSRGATMGAMNMPLVRVERAVIGGDVGPEEVKGARSQVSEALRGRPE